MHPDDSETKIFRLSESVVTSTSASVSCCTNSNLRHQQSVINIDIKKHGNTISNTIMTFDNSSYRAKLKFLRIWVFERRRKIENRTLTQNVCLQFSKNGTYFNSAILISKIYYIENVANFAFWNESKGQNLVDSNYLLIDDW